MTVDLDVALDLPLEGIRVVDLTMNIAGPYAAMILADLGADVVHVEGPAGDDARRMSPVDGDGSAYFYAVNRNKRSVTIDLGTSAGQQRLEAMLATSDVLVTNIRAHKLAQYGFDPHDIASRHPELVVATISAYGEAGADAGRPGYDAVLQARTGIMGVTGERDGAAVRVGVSILDLTSGVWAALGVVAELARRKVSPPRLVSTSLLEVGASFMGYHVAARQLGTDAPARHGSEHPAFAPYGIYRTGEGDLMIGVGADRIFERLAAAIGSPSLVDDPRFASNAERVRHRAELHATLEDALSSRAATEWETVLSSHDVPCSRVVAVDELLDDPQLAAAGMWVDVDLAHDRQLRLPGTPLRFSGRRPPARLAPPHHEPDNEDVPS